VTTETEEPITVLSVPGAFSQVITNLILNAIVHAFAPEQAGTITT
jgi:signal transduction histidine kinase